MKKKSIEEIRNTSAYLNYEQTGILNSIDELLEQRSNLVKMREDYPSYSESYSKEIAAVDYLLSLHK